MPDVVRPTACERASDAFVELCARHLWGETRPAGAPAWDDLSDAVREARLEHMRVVLRGDEQ